MYITLKRISDIIIIDSPPIGLFSDSLAIARKTEEVLFVTRYGKVARRIVKNLIEGIEETGAKVLGVVLNDLPQKKTPGYYYSGYYGYEITLGINITINTMAEMKKRAKSVDLLFFIMHRII